MNVNINCIGNEILINLCPCLINFYTTNPALSDAITSAEKQTV